jgi:magnesium-transporting ATPase (P-type)
LDGGEMKHITA